MSNLKNVIKCIVLNDKSEVKLGKMVYTCFVFINLSVNRYLFFMNKEEENDDNVYVCLDSENQDDQVECVECTSATTGFLQNDRMKFMESDDIQCHHSDIT